MGNIPLNELLKCISIESFGEIALAFSNQSDIIIDKSSLECSKIRGLENYIVYDFYNNNGLFTIESKRNVLGRNKK
ncbi:MULTISPECIES: hypothetical protein [unclassified Clostridium]|uniref:hypothetical protein n=1 Tax=unclassified Clostridium TaxID=2614128 RepID=UPI00207963A6|nr:MULTISPECIES: hypothetical protein [unclassified Clostridium]